VGHREDLLAGAKQCLYEKGYARTTARDIVAASGTNLASIGYHYGSKEALLNAALFEAIGEWGDQAETAISGDDPVERFAQFFGQILDSVPERRHIWQATFDMFGQIDRLPQAREMIAMGLGEARKQWAALLAGIDPETQPEQAAAVGSIFQALLSGLLVQALVDPDRTPTAEQLTEGMRTIAKVFSAKPKTKTA
jgi:AcrR family transcriptional regulator